MTDLPDLSPQAVAERQAQAQQETLRAMRAASFRAAARPQALRMLAHRDYMAAIARAESDDGYGRDHARVLAADYAAWDRGGR